MEQETMEKYLDAIAPKGLGEAAPARGFLEKCQPGSPSQEKGADSRRRAV